MRAPYPWLALLITLAVPVLVLGKAGPDRFLKAPHARVLWFFLIAVAFAGAIRSPWISSDPISIGAVIVFSLPLVQALVFVLLYRGFTAMLHRSPVNFDEARYRRTHDGHKHVWDLIFWFIIIVALIVGGSAACAYFGVDFPVKRHIR
jgi:hypothetical protein